MKRKRGTDMDNMTCLEYLSVVTEQGNIAMKTAFGVNSVEKLNAISNTFQLRSIAYSLAVIADKLNEKGDTE